MIFAMSTKFGNWLATNRKRAGLTQEELGERAGCTRGYISALERGVTESKSQRPIRPDLALVDSIARALQVSQAEARIAAGYAPDALLPDQERAIEDSMLNSMAYKLERLDKKKAEKYRELLRILDRDIDRELRERS